MSHRPRLEFGDLSPLLLRPTPGATGGLSTRAFPALAGKQPVAPVPLPTHEPIALLLAALILAAAPLLAPASEPAPALEVPAAVREAESQRVEMLARIKSCVLAIFDSSGQGGGSGVVITPDGYALTNFHVVQGCGASMKCGMADGRVYDAVLVSIDPTGDVALIRLFGRDDFPAATVGDSDQVRVGDASFALGNPFLLATDFQPTVTHGIISGVRRYQYPAGTILEYADCLQTDASINPGNSGGPLFDAEGRLIGINGRGSFEKRGRVAVGAGYAISINQIEKFLGCLHSGRIVDHATLGAVTAFDDEGRVVVSDILESSDAFRRGLRIDDEIVSLGGRPITTPNAFKNALGVYPKSWRIPLSYRRGGQRHDIYVRLSGVHRESELAGDLNRRPSQEPMPLPNRKPDHDQPGPEDEKEGDDEKPIPLPLPKPEDDKEPSPGAEAQPKKDLPEVVAKHFEARRGYANYYFNKLQRGRVWDAWKAKGGMMSAGAWSLAGPLDTGGKYVFRITDDNASLELPTVETSWAASPELGESLLPEGSGGLLPSLFLWRRLAVLGPDAFGEVYYLGTCPLPGRDRLFDVLVGLHGGVECRFYFDPQQGTLAAIELFPDEEADPCEIYFHDYREESGRPVPQVMEVRFGDALFASFKIAEWKSVEKAKPQSANE